MSHGTDERVASPSFSAMYAPTTAPITLDTPTPPMNFSVWSCADAHSCAPIEVAAASPTIVAITAIAPSAGSRMVSPRLCLLYTSDAADERSSVDLGGR